VLHRHLQFARGCQNDARIRLVRYQPIDVRFLQVVGGEGFVNNSAKRVDGHFKDFVTAHFDEGITLSDLVVAIADTMRHPQQVFVLAVGMYVARQNPGFVVGFENYRTGAVAEKHAGAAILPVENS